MMQFVTCNQFSELDPTSKDPSVKRKRNDSSDDIGPNPEKKFHGPEVETQTESETLVESNLNVEDEANSDVKDETDSETQGLDVQPDSAQDDTSDSNTESESQEDISRLTICLKCGTHMRGSHANVSYCFSEHMCNEQVQFDQQPYLDTICVIANAMHTGKTSDEGAQKAILQGSKNPFNSSNIGRALEELLLQYDNSESSE